MLCDVSRIRNEHKRCLSVTNIARKMHENRSRRFGRVEKRNNDERAEKTDGEIRVEENRRRDKPKK